MGYHKDTKNHHKMHVICYRRASKNESLLNTIIQVYFISGHSPLINVVEKIYNNIKSVCVYERACFTLEVLFVSK